MTIYIWIWRWRWTCNHPLFRSCLSRWGLLRAHPIAQEEANKEIIDQRSDPQFTNSITNATLQNYEFPNVSKSVLKELGYSKSKRYINIDLQTTRRSSSSGWRKLHRVWGDGREDKGPLSCYWIQCCSTEWWALSPRHQTISRSLRIKPSDCSSKSALAYSY